MGKELFMDFPMEHHGTNVVRHLRDMWLASSLLLPPRLPYSHDPDGRKHHWVKMPDGNLKDKPCCEGTGSVGQHIMPFTRHGFNGNWHTLNLRPVGRVDLFLTAMSNICV